MKMIFFAVASILAVVSSELIEDRIMQNERNVKIDQLNDENNSFQSSFENESEDYDQSRESNWLDAVPGVPGKDYPNLEIIPKTSFSCVGKKPGGYYADIETRCQVFHVCNVGNVKSSFLCPPGSIFNQKYLVCDWWYDFECENASDLYSLNDSINREEIVSSSGEIGDHYTRDKNIPLSSRKESSFAHQESNLVNDSGDLSLAGTGEGGFGYSGNKSNRSFAENDQKNINEDKQFVSWSDENSKSVKRIEKQSNLNNHRRHEFSQNEQNNNFNNKNFNSDNFNSNNNQGQSKDFLQSENKNQFPDYIPRGFAANYGKIQNLNYNQNNQNSYQNSNPSDLHKELNSELKNDFEKRHRNKNSNNRKDFGKEKDSDFDEDKFDRQRQEEVDSTILNKKIVNYENRQSNFESDFVMSFENPSFSKNGNYYNNEKYYDDESNIPSFSKFNSKSEDDSKNRNRYLNVNDDRAILDSNTGERRTLGGFGNGLGNAGSNAITGTSEIKSSSQQPVNYSNSRDIINSKVFTNKENAGHSDIIKNLENNEFSSRDISRFKNKNEQSSNYQQKSDQYVPSFNYDEGSQQKTRGFQYT